MNTLGDGHAIIEAHKRPTKCKGFSAARRLIAQTHRAVGTTPRADARGLADMLHVLHIDMCCTCTTDKCAENEAA